MINLDNIVNIPGVLKMEGSLKLAIRQIYFDSREAQKDGLFVAIRGTNTDGHKYISEAIRKGCTAVICEKWPETRKKNITYIQVHDSAEALGLIASNYYSTPSSGLKLIGITGTNGKTTIATLLYRLFEKMGYRSGLLSTIENMIHDKRLDATHTTPDAIQINRILHDMISDGCEYCFMEVSSHAIDQKRISGLTFAGGVFTNITHEHLDYHKDFKSYLNTKKLFFDYLPGSAFALVNIDDKNGRIMVQNTSARVKTYSLKSVSDFKGKILETHFDGMLLKIQDKEVWISFIGEFNAYNVLALFAVSCLLGMEEEEVLSGISKLKQVRGRAETLTSVSGVTAIIDYAHTPDALHNIIEAINAIKYTGQKLITVVGAGGDRDRTKRPLMGRIAAINSDRVILTSDNPRTEDPEKIIEEMKGDLSNDASKKVITIVNRFEAIKTALMLAEKGDVILIAGKGHETYQEIAGERTYFDDREVIRTLMNQ